MRPYPQTTSYLKPIGIGACLSGALLAVAPSTYGQAAETGNTTRIERLEKENQELRKRLEALEGVRGPDATASIPTNVLRSLTSSTLSGFVTTSYFFNSTRPSDRQGDGYLWTTRHNSFSLNKVKLTLASPPAEASGDKWGAGYRVSMIWGEDAPLVDTGLGVSGFGNVREAYVDLNVPVGTGLNIKAGQLISLLNWESGDGGAANPNFSQGYQWFFTGNGPSTGVQLGYTFTDWLDLKLRVQNGLYSGAVDENSAKTFIGSIGLKPAKGLWANLIGWAGSERSLPNLRRVEGGSVLAGYDVTQQFHTGFEFDYFNFDLMNSTAAKLWSVGGWAWYDFTPSVGLALRGEYLDDADGYGINGVAFPGRPLSGIGSVFPGHASPDSDGRVESIALTVNWRPVPQLKIQPEVRYDHTTYTGGFDGQKNRVVFGAGASYLF